MHTLEDGDPTVLGADEIVALCELVSDRAGGHDEPGDDHDERQPADPTTDLAAPVFLDQRRQVIIRFRFEVTVFGWGGFERVKKQARQPQWPPYDIVLEDERRGGGSDGDRRQVGGIF